MKTALVALPRWRIDAQNLSYWISKALQNSLIELGFEAKLIAAEEGGKAQYLFVPWDCEMSLERCEHETAIHVTSERLPYEGSSVGIQERWGKIQPKLKQFDFIFEHSARQTQFLKDHGYRALHFPWGYAPVLDMWQYGCANLSQNQVSVSFIGTKTKRRRVILGRLRRKGIQVHCQERRSSDQAAILAARSAISLNIHQDEDFAFEAGRIVCLLMANRTLVITEPYQDDELPFINKQHLVIAERKILSRTIWAYIKEPDKRIAIAEAGYDFVKNHYTMTQHLKGALVSAGL